MRRWQNREELIHQTVALFGEGLSRRAVARTLGVSRNTVKKILGAHAEAREEPHTALPQPPKRAPRAKKTDPYRGRVEQLLTKYTSITAQRVFEILREEEYDGGYTAVKKLVRALRPTGNSAITGFQDQINCTACSPTPHRQGPARACSGARV